MPANSVELPKDEEALCRVVNQHFDRERARMLPQTTMFRIVWEYLAGMRNFTVVDLNTGMVKAQMTDKEGKMEFQGSDLLRAIDQIVGYLGSYDLTPKVKGEGQSLSAVRESATGQVIADSVFSTEAIEKATTIFSHIYASLGSCGIMAHIEDNPANGIGLAADIEVVHPMELVPFPSIGMDLSKVTGIGREYFIPLSVLYKMKGKAWVNDKLPNLYWFQLQVGEEPSVRHGYAYGPTWWNSQSFVAPSNSGAPMKPNEEAVGFVRIRELWLDGPKGTCRQKVAISDRTVIQNMDFEGIEAYTPIGFARFIENGTFHGAGMYHVLFSVARNLELMHKTLFQDVVDRDHYGFLVLPQGSYNVNAVLQEVGKGLKLLPWEPDSIGESGAAHRPFVVPPVSAGDAATRVAVYGKQYFDALNPLADLVKEKGRIDSQTGLAFLQEQIDRAMTSPTKGVIMAFGQMYKAALAKCATMLLQTPRPIPVTRMTLDLAGAVIDWEKNEVRFSQNPLPSISRISCRPKMVATKSGTQRKMEAMQLLENQLTTPQKVIIKSIEEGWDFATDLSMEEAARNSIIRSILTLFNDGQRPGQLVANPNFVRPDIQQAYLDTFMASYKMESASVDVQNEFIAFREFMIQQSGRTLPAGLPYNADDVASVLGGSRGVINSLPQGR